MSAMAPYHLTEGASPILISVPHCGTHIPDGVLEGMTDEAKVLTDTDWHVDRLYRCLTDQDVTLLSATHSRYVIDLNRPPDGQPLYPGQTETALCPVETFAGKALYCVDQDPGPDEIQRRLETYWQPYHAALRGQIARLKALHGQVLLWDAHSIANEVPRLFDGRLPDLNFGTNGGQACDETLLEAVMEVARAQDRYSYIANGRFKGGYITRHYGDPKKEAHAIQLELSQDTYMDQTPPFKYRDDKASQFQILLKQFFATLLQRFT